jgi:hypothetical protein
MHTPTRSLLAVFTVLSVPAQLAACGPAAMDPDPRFSHRQPIAEKIEDPVRAEEAELHEAAPPRAAWVGLAASRGASGVLAAWTKSRVAVSRDDGKHYHYVLDGKGDVSAAAMDDAGTLFAARGASLGVVKRSGESVWRAIPFAKTTSSLVAGTGTLAWIGERTDRDGASLAISRDDGVTWIAQTGAPALGDFSNALAVEPDGTLRLMTSNESDCGGGWQARFVGNAATGEWKEAAWPLDAPGNWGIGDEGWSYAVGDCGDGASGKLCAIDPDGNATAVATTRASTFKAMHAVTNGRATWATIDGRLAWLSRGDAMFPASAAPKGFALAAVDADGAPIGIADGHAVRWSRDGRWRALFGR